MDVDLDEDFANFESVSQMSLVSTVDEELILLDSEVTRREHQYQDEKREKNNNEVCQTSGEKTEKSKKKCFDREENKDEVECLPSLSATSEDGIFTTFPFGVGAKRLTMIPVKYKLKDERRKILKISVNKLKKIEDPESWLCRSVLINNTMKKLQKETRNEKTQKHSSEVSVFLSSDLSPNLEDNDSYKCRFNQGDKYEEGGAGKTWEKYEKLKGGARETTCTNIVVTTHECHEKGSFDGAKCEESIAKSENTKETSFSRESENNLDKEFFRERVKLKTAEGKISGTDFEDAAYESGPCGELEECLYGKKCSNESKSSVVRIPQTCQRQEVREGDEVDECDVHDVLSQMYLPPTPRMLTSIDSDTDEDELNVVDVDVDEYPRTECSTAPSVAAVFSREGSHSSKRSRADDVETVLDASGHSSKRRKSCCGGSGTQHFLNSTCERCSTSTRITDPVELLLETEEAKDKKRFQSGGKEECTEKTVSRSLSSGYQPSAGPKVLGESLFEENCDGQYSCGQVVSMFAGDLQTPGFHNLIAGLET